MREIKLSTNKILELANMFLSSVVSIYEFEKICDIPADAIIRIFREDLTQINLEKAKSVNKILDIPGYLQHTGYIKENTYQFSII